MDRVGFKTCLVKCDLQKLIWMARPLSRVDSTALETDKGYSKTQ